MTLNNQIGDDHYRRVGVRLGVSIIYYPRYMAQREREDASLFFVISINDMDIISLLYNNFGGPHRP